MQRMLLTLMFFTVAGLAPDESCACHWMGRWRSSQKQRSPPTYCPNASCDHRGKSSGEIAVFVTQNNAILYDSIQRNPNAAEERIRRLQRSGDSAFPFTIP